MASISVYGYNSEILADLEANLAAEQASKTPDETYPRRSLPKTCLLFQLPFELRAQIYSYIMPTTIHKPIFGIMWRRASAPIWATSRKLYNECISMLYSDCTFDIDVKFDSIIFHHQYERGSLTLRRNYNFPAVIPARTIDLLRKIHIRVHQLDSYTGMVNHNHENSTGLAIGVGMQVRTLCNTLRQLPQIRELQITYAGHSHESAELMPHIMEPFRVLKNTKAVTFVGFDAFDPDYPVQLLNHLNNAYTRNSILSLPSEIRAEIYRHVLPYSTCAEVDGSREVVWHPGDASIMRSCRSVFEETYHLLYGLNDFEFTWMLR